MAGEILCDVPAQHESDSGSGREYPMWLDGRGRRRQRQTEIENPQGCPGGDSGRGVRNGAERVLSQRQSRALGRDGAFLCELRGDRERKDSDRNLQRGTTFEAAPRAECLLYGLWPGTLPGEMKLKSV